MQGFFASIFMIGALAAPASAQPIPTVDLVSANVGASCAGNAVTAVCLTAINNAIQVAGLYNAAGNLPPQVEIGFMLCQVANANPGLRQAILDLITNSGIPMLQTGCSSALQTAAGGGGGGGGGGGSGDSDNGANPTDADQCRNGGWAEFGFRNQGQCIRYVNTGTDTRPVVTPA
jgi:hypothetical protein